MNVDHLKVNIGNNVMRLFLYVDFLAPCFRSDNIDYLTPCFRSDNIANVDVQGRQHRKKMSLCLCSQFSVDICTVTLPITSGWGHMWVPELIYSWSTCNKLWWSFPLKTIPKSLVIYFLSSFTCVRGWFLYVCTNIYPKILIHENRLINDCAMCFLDVT